MGLRTSTWRWRARRTARGRGSRGSWGGSGGGGGGAGVGGGLRARTRADGAALHEMPVAPGVGKVRAHAAAGRVNVRFDTVKGPSPEAAFERMLGLKSTAAIEMGKRAWAEGVPFRAFAPLSEADGAVKEGAEKRAVKRLDLGGGGGG